MRSGVRGRGGPPKRGQDVPPAGQITRDWVGGFSPNVGRTCRQRAKSPAIGSGASPKRGRDVPPAGQITRVCASSTCSSARSRHLGRRPSSQAYPHRRISRSVRAGVERPRRRAPGAVPIGLADLDAPARSSGGRRLHELPRWFQDVVLTVPAGVAGPVPRPRTGAHRRGDVRGAEYGGNRDPVGLTPVVWPGDSQPLRHAASLAGDVDGAARRTARRSAPGASGP